MSGPDEHATELVRTKEGADELRLPGLRLVVIAGPDQGLEHAAKRGTIRIGTGANADLKLTDRAVSRAHCELRLRASEVRIVDLESRNGTRVDGVGVYDARLGPASLVTIGETTIRAVTEDEPVVIPISKNERFGALLGRSLAMREVFAILERVAVADVNVLVEGETGTGKELAAEGIHRHSPRRKGPFIAIDCGAIAETLIESELFGHVRGSFTGAQSDRRGAFEEAHGGTLFLDEIGELPIELQPKLLRALEKREIRRVGTTQPKAVDVRIVAATNRDLAVGVEKGTFREDLFYRLAVVRVRLPSLRARPDDISLLVAHFFEQLAPGGPAPSPGTLRALQRRSWPGNVRELRNAVQRALALELHEGAPALGTARPAEGPEALFGLPYKEAQEIWLSRIERPYFEALLAATGGNVSSAARAAGLSRRYMQRLLARLGLRATAADDGPDEPDEPDESDE